MLPRVRGRADVRRARGHEQQRDLVPGPGTRGPGHSRGHVARDQLGAGLRPVSVPGNNIYCIYHVSLHLKCTEQCVSVYCIVK